MGCAPAPPPAQKRRSPITALAPFTVHTAQRVRTAYYQDPKGQVLSTELSTDGVSRKGLFHCRQAIHPFGGECVLVRPYQQFWDSGEADRGGGT